MRTQPGRYIIPTIVSLAPVALLLLTWRPSGHFSEVERVVKWLAVPVLVVELFVIAVALRRGAFAATLKAVRPVPGVVAAAILVAIAVGTAVFAAPDPPVAGLLTALWILHALYGLSVMHLCGAAFDRGSFTTAVIAGYALFAALIVAFAIAVPARESFDWVGGMPAVPNVRHLGFYAGAVLGLCMGRFAIVRSRIGWAATVAVATLAFALPLWNGTRGTFAAVAVALIAGIVLFPDLRRLRVFLGLTAALGLSVALVSQVPVPHALWGLPRMVAAATGGDVTSDRDTLWQATLDAIARRPLFGYGEGQIKATTGRSEIHPHNSVLQVLHAWGFVGAACVLALGVLFARFTVLTVRRQGGESLPPCMALMVLAIYSAHDGTLIFPLSVSLAAACAGLVAASAGASDAAVPLGPTEPVSVA